MQGTCAHVIFQKHPVLCVHYTGISTRRKIPIIGATNSQNLMDSAFQSRFGEQVEVPPPITVTTSLLSKMLAKISFFALTGRKRGIFRQTADADKCNKVSVGYI